MGSSLVAPAPAVQPSGNPGLPPSCVRCLGLVYLAMLRVTEVTAVTAYAREEVREGGRVAEVTVTDKEVIADEHAMNAAVVMTE